MKIKQLGIKTPDNTWESRKALFLGYNQLKKLMDYRLKSLLGRDVRPIVFQDDNRFEVYVDEYTQEEHKILLEAAFADENYRNFIMRFRKDVYCIIGDLFAVGLIEPEMPFAIENWIAVDEGIYFFSDYEDYVKEYKSEDNHG